MVVNLIGFKNQNTTNKIFKTYLNKYCYSTNSRCNLDSTSNGMESQKIYLYFFDCNVEKVKLSFCFLYNALSL